MDLLRFVQIRLQIIHVRAAWIWVEALLSFSNRRKARKEEKLAQECEDENERVLSKEKRGTLPPMPQVVRKPVEPLYNTVTGHRAARLDVPARARTGPKW